MTRSDNFPCAALTAIALLGTVAGISLNAGPANAVVYCKYIGVPKGCVARAGVVLVPAPVVVRDRGAPRRWRAPRHAR